MGDAPSATRAKPAPPAPSWAGEALAHLDALYNLGRYLTTSAAEADDLVQETYARALARASTFQGGNLKAWLFTILRHVLVDVRRKGKPLVGLLDLEDAAASDGPASNALPPAALARLLASDLQMALATLSEEARTLVLLDLEGFTETEMAAIMGCAIGTVKSRLSRSRQALRERLKDYAR